MKKDIFKGWKITYGILSLLAIICYCAVPIVQVWGEEGIFIKGEYNYSTFEALRLSKLLGNATFILPLLLLTLMVISTIFFYKKSYKKAFILNFFLTLLIIIMVIFLPNQRIRIVTENDFLYQSIDGIVIYASIFIEIILFMIITVIPYLIVKGKIKKNFPKYREVEIVNLPNNNFSIPDEIKKYKELLDSNAITQEEYEKKKKQLLFKK